MSIWHDTDEHSAIRLLAVWLLLERSEQALSKSLRTPADSAQAEGGQPVGWPPAPAPCPDAPEHTDAKRELVLLLARECEQKATPQETRRIAELLEYLDRDEEALTWWQWAAERGDEDARDYLELLQSEAQERGHTVTGLSASSPHPEEDTAQFFRKASGMTASSHTFAAVQLALHAATGPETNADAQRLVQEIEDYLQHPDRMTDERHR